MIESVKEKRNILRLGQESSVTSAAPSSPKLGVEQKNTKPPRTTQGRAGSNPCAKRIVGLTIESVGALNTPMF